MCARAAPELARRPTREPDHACENRALLGLARDLAATPQHILQRMADVALELCRAHSSGFSLLTEDGERFEWASIAGRWAAHVGGGTPRDFGPCGMVLDCDEPLLFWHPETAFPYLAEATPCIDEGLLLPFHVAGKAVGTIWIISHDESRRFDAEDLRIMTSLAVFASAAYQAQRDSEHRFREILDALPAAVYTTDTRGRITQYNKAAVDTAGRVPRLGTDEWCVSWKLHRPNGDPLPHDECPMAVALKEERPVRGAEIVIERPDGSRLHAMPYPTPLYDPSGKLRGAINMIVDVTERKRVEDHLRAIVETTPECVKLVARDGTLLEMNSAGLAMVGAQSPDRVVGRSVYDLVAPEHRDAFRAFNEGVCDGRRGTLEFDVIDLAGVRHHMETHAVPLRTPDGATVQLALARDVTERRRAERLLREADRRKDEFIATLSHELRNPLAPLRSALNVLRLQGRGADDGTRRVHEIMDRQLSHLVRLVDDLLEVSRITTGAIELKRERMDLSGLLRSAVEASAPVIREAGHELTLQLPEQPLEIDGDRVRLTQVFSNLLNNAARFTDKGGRITLSAAVANGRAQVSVSDSGRGFDPASAGQLFDMFAKGRNSTGLGIGLALARRLARLHDGDIEARSDGEGRGAEFIVSLPLATPALDAPAPLEPPAAESPALTRRVLVADDNEDSAEMLAALVRTLGAEVCVAFDGQQAIDAARSFRPDVVVLDIGMPNVDGYEAARRIRTEAGATGLQIIALTGWGQESDRRRARDAGFDAHLVKPVDLDALRGLLEANPR